MGKDKKIKYDGLVCFEKPVCIRDDFNRTILIYGLLFEKDKRHKDDLWTWELNRFISFLQGCEKAQNNGCRISPDKIIMPNGKEIKLTVEVKNIIYKIIKPEIIDYTINEYYEPLETNESEVEDMFVISQPFIVRNWIAPAYKISDKS